MNEKRTVCFTGHRYIEATERARLKTVLEQEVERQILCGAEVFRAGGALGFDTMAALAVLKLRKKYPHVRLELILPCPTQTLNWHHADVELYHKIRIHADAYRYVSDSYYHGLLQLRNHQLVDGSHVCIAYLRSSHGGGTAYTCALALRSGLEFVNLME